LLTLEVPFEWARTFMAADELLVLVVTSSFFFSVSVIFFLWSPNVFSLGVLSVVFFSDLAKGPKIVRSWFHSLLYSSVSSVELIFDVNRGGPLWSRPAYFQI